MQPTNTGGWPWYNMDGTAPINPWWTITYPEITLVCPCCGAFIPMQAKYCPACGIQIWQDEEKDKVDIIIEKLDEIIELLRGNENGNLQ